MRRATTAALVISLSPLVAASADAAPTPTIVSCNFPVVESIILQNSLFNCPNDGLRVMADNVTIDLNGHLVDGNANDDFADQDEVGIDNTGEHTGLVVRDGTLRDFENGMLAGNGGSGVVEDVAALDNGLGFVLFGERWTLRRNTAAGSTGHDSIPGHGFFIGGRGDVVGNLSTDNAGNGFSGNRQGGVVRGNRAVSNGEDGFALSARLPASLRRNKAIGNGDDGFDSFISGRSELVANVASSNRSDGYDLGNGAYTLVGNRAEGNSQNGFYIFSGVGHRLIENAAVGNAANGFFLEGIFAPTVSQVTMRLNKAKGNRGDGIDVDVDTLKIVENKAHRNGFDNGDDDGSGLGIRDAGSTSVTARRNRADGNADATECSATMRCS